MTRFASYSLAAVGVLFSVFGLTAEEKDAAALIQQLDSDQYAERAAAAAKLEALGDPALGPMKAALKTTQSTEARQTLQKLLLKMDAETVDGLKLRLAADKRAIKPGEAFTLTITLENTEAKILTVPLGRTDTFFKHRGNDSLSTGEVVEAFVKEQWFSAKHVPPPGVIENFVSGPAAPAELPAHGKAKFKLQARRLLHPAPRGDGKPHGTDILALDENQRMQLEVPKSGSLRLRVKHYCADQGKAGH